MTDTRDPAAVSMGSRTSERKAQAARENGKRGGIKAAYCTCRHAVSRHRYTGTRACRDCACLALTRA